MKRFHLKIKFSDYFSPKLRIKVEGINEIDWQTIDSPIKRASYLAIREAIQNTVKYAEADKISVDFKVAKKELHLSILDNGKGFDSTQTPKGIGLKNLKERITELNGAVSINSSKEKGTEINIIVPLNV